VAAVRHPFDRITTPTSRVPDAELPEITAVERLTLRPGDALAIRFPGQISFDQARHVIDRVRATLRLDDSFPILILPAGSSAQVIEAPGDASP
jgi:hypothetical protein